MQKNIQYDHQKEEKDKVDLHYHLDEGARSPLEEFIKCIEEGYDVVAFTEHSCVDGLIEIDNVLRNIKELKRSMFRLSSNYKFVFDSRFNFFLRTVFEDDQELILRALDNFKLNEQVCLCVQKVYKLLSNIRTFVPTYDKFMTLYNNSKTKILPSVELNCYMPNISNKKRKIRRVHILGLNINFRNQLFQDELIRYQEIDSKRTERSFSKVKLKVRKDTGKIITFDEFLGATKTYDHATTDDLTEFLFMVYDGKKDKEFLKREYFHYKSKTYVGHSQALDILNTIEFIERYNGIPIVAHPDNLSLEELVYLKRKGIKGIEVYSPKFEDEEIKERKMWAENLRLFVTGGSDGDEKYEPLPFFKFKQLFDVYGLRFKYL